MIRILAGMITAVCAIIILAGLLLAIIPAHADELDWTKITQAEQIEPTLNADQRRDIRCLTEALWFEARGQPENGQVAVVNVIMNRAHWNKKHPDRQLMEFKPSICGTIAFKYDGTCAFSYRCERGFARKLQAALRQRPDDWQDTKALASYAYLNYTPDNKSGEYYHANYVRPSWSRVYQVTERIGDHIFYTQE